MENNNRVILYESSSFGGNYRYAHELSMAYAKNEKTVSVELILPSNSTSDTIFAKKILLNDLPKGNLLWIKFHFLFRNLVNPLVLFFWLLFKPKSLVIFNDFEQLFSPVWVPLYKLFLQKHTFCIFLHDPDRDAYPPNKCISTFTMKCLLWICTIAFYHEFLPKKSYYSGSKIKFVSVPHGVYPQPDADSELLKQIELSKGSAVLLSILGNIRLEKNYEQVLRCLVHLPDCKLLIAGKPSNSSVNLDALRQLAVHLGVENRIIWLIRYLTEAELSATIEATDICLLNYLPSFTSQSGLINMYAPYKKNVIVSNIESGLSSLNTKYKFGVFCDPLDDTSFILAVQHVRNNNYDEAWSNYLHFASWDNHVNLVLSSIQ